jgi:peptidoglycan/LPS O-acetylase OafA/YrhL
MLINQLTKWGGSIPRKLFLIDGFGAVLSAFLLGVVLVKLERFFGIPESTLYFLASFPCIFALYDFYCYYRIRNNPDVFIKAIGIVNLFYCCLSLAMAIYHNNVITYLGWTYILLEIALVMMLAIVELSVARNLNSAKLSKYNY